MRLARRWPVAFFLVAAVLITYAVGALAFLALRTELVLKFGPSLAALLTVGLISGQDGVRDLLRRVGRVRFPVGLYAFALLAPALVLTGVLLTHGYGGELSLLSPGTVLQVFGVQLVLNALLGGGLGEELGWRGFLQPQLEKTRSPLAASLLVAVAWFAWHLPAYALFGKGDDDPLLPFALIMAPWSVALSWITLRSGGSLLAPILLHASMNAASYTLVELLPAATRRGFQPAFDWITALAWCVVSGTIVASSGRALGKRPSSA